MTEPQSDRQEQAPREERAVNMDKIRADLEARAQEIDSKIDELEQAKFVSQETLRLEFKV